MQLARFTRVVGSALLLSTLTLAGALSASSTAATTTVPKTVTGKLIKRANGTLAPGTVVRSSTLGQRVFTNASNGFALANTGGAQYPAATTDGGTVWRTDGPALHVDAAQAPLAVISLGAANRRTIYAYGTGQVVDVTSDGGKHWYQALFEGLSMAVVPGIGGHLVAFVDGTATGKGVTWQYVSKNGGRTWSYDAAVGGS
ncbi:MAG: hypothetical protein ACLPTJ_06665 [Solirubrobacteraceae bacterium]